MKRFAEYEGWTSDAAPIRLTSQRLFMSCAAIQRETGERFVFCDLGNRVYREQAHERAIEWAKRWIENNFGYAATARQMQGNWRAVAAYPDLPDEQCDGSDADIDIQARRQICGRSVVFSL